MPQALNLVRLQPMMLCFPFILVILATSLFTHKVVSAEITVVETETPLKIILFRGEIASGDYIKFMNVAREVRRGAVVLESPGGNLRDGLDIGRAIKDRGYSTGVLPKGMCASACGLMWLAGTTRFMATDSSVGFHAAYLTSESGSRETGLGNALIGAYLTDLGLPIEAVEFMTVAGPEEMNWLTISGASKNGIDVQAWRPVTQATYAEQMDIELRSLLNPSENIPNPCFSCRGDQYSWIILDRSRQLDALPLEKSQGIFGVDAVTVIKSADDNQYSLAAGPFEAGVAEVVMQDLKEIGNIRESSYVMSDTFVRENHYLILGPLAAGAP